MTTLGILCLSNVGTYHGQDPDFGPGIVRNYGSSPKVKCVPGAWASNIVLGDPSFEERYVQSARELVREGADAITCDCGFTVRFQHAIATAVSVPVSTSSLLILPTLLSTVPANKKIAVLTADSRCLGQDIMAILGITDQSRLVIEGLEGTASYRYMWAEEAEINVKEVLADADDMIARIRKHESIAAILCECTIFARVSRRIRRATGLPVYDAAVNAALLIAAAG
ncbi:MULTISPECIES: hypothetical protein [unclassified Bradyrhizobium]|uniref:hypothetical protein n=1 Tax=unclassified Bradyrhizobium TaxID=2631580 RepID=UPI001FF950C1|nr:MULTISPECIES: hypothetical protein [unclassified Bradyrhizobium]MCK1611619.1 hypothetical protein [Bradyrhizobium sp. 163]MCK1767316.1 hypothetical protein [Bradyrhizobium sp. 136]